MSDLTERQWRNFGRIKRREGSVAAHAYASEIRRRVYQTNRTRLTATQHERIDAAFRGLTQGLMRMAVAWTFALFFFGGAVASFAASLFGVIALAQALTSYVVGRLVT